MESIAVVCNPIAGNGLSLTASAAVQTSLKGRDIPFTYLQSEHPRHATELAKQAALSGAATCIAIGGDGTLLEVAQGLYGTETALGIIPAGTGNDFIKTIGTPKETEKALDAILTLPPRKTDIVTLNDRVFLNETGTGFDVMVLDYAEKAKKYVKGLLPYLYGVLKTIFHYSGIHLTYQADDGKPVEKDILVLGAGNGRFIGGGIPIAPEAIPDDGLLDLVIVEEMRKLRMLSVLPGLMQGKILSFKETTFTRIRSLLIEGKGLRINIDGEIIPLDRAEITVRPGALLVHRP
ncbi:MAG: diacylglycerol kinase family lipid kinase [Clostridia bacterium]|nr:diacylglycerol kinase family lipid kinase [Clostridia bacterium]